MINSISHFQEIGVKNLTEIFSNYTDAKARMLEKAVESSYRKGGNYASISEQDVSKETVMKKLHALQFPKVPCLFISDNKFRVKEDNIAVEKKLKRKYNEIIKRIFCGKTKQDADYMRGENRG